MDIETSKDTNKDKFLDKDVESQASMRSTLGSTDLHDKTLDHSEEELAKFAKYGCFDYLPSQSQAYRDWLTKHSVDWQWDRWLVMGLIGVVVGLVGVLLHQCIHFISHFKWHHFQHVLDHNGIWQAYGFSLGYSVLFALLATGFVVIIHLPAGGSGMPEVISFLNGTVQRHVLNMRTFFVKFLSCACAVGSGLPIGPEGPMIHMGSILGTGISQLASQTLHCSLPFVKRFRNPKDRRDCTVAGAGSGVAAAFKSPVGGLLFAVEEVASFWNLRLGFMMLFACMLSCTAAELFNTAFDSFEYKGDIGVINPYKYIVFKLHSHIAAMPSNILTFLPAILLGLVGGALGGLFTIINVQVAKLRLKFYGSIKNKFLQRLLRMVEPVTLMILWVTLTSFIPVAYPCKPMVCPQQGQALADMLRQGDAHGHSPNVPMLDIRKGYSVVNHDAMADYKAKKHGDDNHGNPDGGQHGNHHAIAPRSIDHRPAREAPGANVGNIDDDYYDSLYETDADHHGGDGGHGDGHHAGPPATNASFVYCPSDPDHHVVDASVVKFMCHAPMIVDGNTVFGEYNEAATLLDQDTAAAIKLLFSRGTPYQFGYASLLVILPVYFLFASLCAGSAIASGVFVPMLFVGALYGRALGRAMVDIVGVQDAEYWRWIDPGVMAMIGAASFLAGLSRLSMAAVVIMIEITNDLVFLLPIMVAVMVAKWVGDLISHSLYHLLMEVKCIPYLGNDPVVYDHHNNFLNLEFYTARDVMSPAVATITPLETVDRLAHLIRDTTRGDFIVNKFDDKANKELFYGMITREELSCILCDKSVQSSRVKKDTRIIPTVPFEKISSDQVAVRRNPLCKNLDVLIERYVSDSKYLSVRLDLSYYVNTSNPSVRDDFSLQRAYALYHSFGLRNLPVISASGEALGLITRQDLIVESMEEKLPEATIHSIPKNNFSSVVKRKRSDES